MNVTLPNGDTKSLVTIQDLSYIPLCEESDDFNSKEYKKYKPYQLPEPSRYNEKFYDPNDYIANGECHMCDIRRTGCMSQKTPRYYCKKGKESVQMKLFDF